MSAFSDILAEQQKGKPMRIYVAGPMRGYVEWNFPAFDRAASAIRALGHEVVSPAEIDREIGFNEKDPEAVFTDADFAEAMKRDYAALMGCDAIAFLRGWKASTGSRRERTFGQLLGLALYDFDERTVPCLTPQPEFDAPTPFLSVIEQMRATHDKKQADYGRDTDPFANVRASSDFGVSAWVGCMIRANDKMRRLQTFAVKGALKNESVEDSLLDLAVYAVIGLCLYQEENPRPVPKTDPLATEPSDWQNLADGRHDQ